MAGRLIPNQQCRPAPTSSLKRYGESRIPGSPISQNSIGTRLPTLRTLVADRGCRWRSQKTFAALNATVWSCRRKTKMRRFCRTGSEVSGHWFIVPEQHLALTSGSRSHRICTTGEVTSLSWKPAAELGGTQIRSVFHLHRSQPRKDGSSSIMACDQPPADVSIG